MAWRWSIPKRAKLNGPSRNLGSCCLPIRTTPPGTSWRRRPWTKPGGARRRRKCWWTGSLRLDAQATATRNQRWKLCWRNWDRQRHPAPVASVLGTPAAELCSAERTRASAPTRFVRYESVCLLRHSHHEPFHQPWKKLVELDHGVHRPGNDDFSLVLLISSEHRAGNALRRDATDGARPHLLLFPSLEGVGSESGAYVAGADGHYVDSGAFQFNARGFAHCIQRKFRGAIKCKKRHREVTGDAGNIDDRARGLLLQDGDHGLHGGERAEEICIEGIAGKGHIHLRHGIEDAVAGIVHPNVDAAEATHGETNPLANLPALADVASKRQRALGMADAAAGSFGAGGVAR